MASSRRPAFLALLAVALVAFLVVATLAQGRSAGSPADSATKGCTCHSQQPSTSTTVKLEGAPATYEPGKSVALTLTVEGPGIPVSLPVPLHQGGFALVMQGSMNRTPGLLSSLDGTTEVDGQWTHTSDGNQKRSWKLQWHPPKPGTGPVTFLFAGNAVNGDQTSAGDAWAKATLVVDGPNETNETTGPPVPGPVSTPSVPWALAAFGCVIAAATRRW